MGNDDLDLDLFTAWLRSWGASDRTVKERLVVTRAFIAAYPDFPHTRLSDVQTWLGREHLAQWSRVTYFSHLASAFGWAVESGLIDASPLTGVRRPRGPRRRPRPLSAEDVALLLSAAQGRERAWVILALYGGLRAHEVAKIRGEDFDGPVLYVRGKGDKDAFLPVHPEMAALRARYPRHGWWFPSPRAGGSHIAARTVSTTVAATMHTLGIEGGLHRCRHSFGTTLLRSGVNVRVVQSLLRHESLAATENYLEVVEDERASAIGLLDFAA